MVQNETFLEHGSIFDQMPLMTPSITLTVGIKCLPNFP